MSDSPRLVVVLYPEDASAGVLRAAGAFTGTGLLEVKRRILTGEPVVDEEMFSNAWFDERAQSLLALLSDWQDQGLVFEIREVAAGDDSADAAPIPLEVLRNIIESDEKEWRDDS